jgi:uncharacterized protein (DUF1778 family)
MSSERKKVYRTVRRGHSGPKAGGEWKRITLYPKEKLLALIVKAAKRNGQSLSNFILLTVANAEAKYQGKPLTQLLPAEEFMALVEKKYLYGKKK